MEDGILVPYRKSRILEKGREELGLSSRSMMRMVISMTKRAAIMVLLLTMKTMISLVQRYNSMVQW